MSKSSYTLPLLVVILVLATARASAAGDEEHHRLTAQNAISMSIREVHETEQFVQFILNLRTLRFTQQAAHIEPCVNGLLQDLNKMKSNIRMLTDPERKNINLNTDFLEKKMSHILQLGQRCSHSLKNVDMVVPSMLTRKIDDLSMVIHDLIFHGSVMMDNNVYGGHA